MFRTWRERLFGKADGAETRSASHAFRGGIVAGLLIVVSGCAAGPLPIDRNTAGFPIETVVSSPDPGDPGPPPRPTYPAYTVAQLVDGPPPEYGYAGLVRWYGHALADVDRNGHPAGTTPGYGLRAQINSVIAESPERSAAAREADARYAGGHRDPLGGVPIYLKDNIETADMPTTAGSLALVDNAPGRDAPLVTRLRDAGAVILGKANLSEWANIRSSSSISGWSAVGGQTRNPYDPERTPCGSSAGSAVAVAIGLAPAAIGTETDGSITCPASVNGVVGFKPTVGLVSRTHIIPISHSQDTAGPITTTVLDAAIILSVIAGSDPLDPATAEADAHLMSDDQDRIDFAQQLDPDSLNGARIGVLRFLVPNYSAETQAVFEANLQVLRDAGAELVEITEAPAEFRQIGGWELTVLLTELKHDLNLYLASTDPAQVKTRTLADVIAFNAAEPRETVLFGQDLFERAEATGGLTDPAYVEARERSFRAAGPEGIDRMMAEHGVIALTAPTTSRAWTNDPDDDDRSQGSASRLAAVAGYPHLTVPMGFDRGMPVGISFMAGKWDDAKVLSRGYAFEQRTRARRAPTL